MDLDLKGIHVLVTGQLFPPSYASFDLKRLQVQAVELVLKYLGNSWASSLYLS
jgi:hypothetical protein